MIQALWTQESHGMTWIDVVSPTQAELEELSKKYGLTQRVVLDCMDSSHLPKFERLTEDSDRSFAILRAYDPKSRKNAQSIQSMTRKVALFFGTGLIITLHRTDEEFFKEFRNRELLPSQKKEGPSSLAVFLDLFEAVVLTYKEPLLKIRTRLEELEEQTFRGLSKARTSRLDLLEEGYYLKRKLSVMKRMLRLSEEIRVESIQAFECKKPSGIKGKFQNIKEAQERVLFEAEELSESLNGLLNLHLSISSHRTNDVMRVLTLFSVFFMPLTFIVGIYGMNFEHMPELHWVWGYPAVLGVMAVVCFVLLVWFKRQRWL